VESLSAARFPKTLPYIYDQNLRFLIFLTLFDFDSLFMTVAAGKIALNIVCEAFVDGLIDI